MTVLLLIIGSIFGSMGILMLGLWLSITFNPQVNGGKMLSRDSVISYIVSVVLLYTGEHALQASFGEISNTGGIINNILVFYTYVMFGVTAVMFVINLVDTVKWAAKSSRD